MYKPITKVKILMQMDFKEKIIENKNSIIGGLFLIFSLFLFLSANDAKVKKEQKIFQDRNQEISRKVVDYESILKTIEAKSFYVYDILGEEAIFFRDEHKQLPLASITKLISGMVVLDVMPENTIITISREDIAMEGDSGLYVGEKWKLKDLLDFSLMTSSNDGMHAVSSALNNYQNINDTDTVRIMNERVALLGLEDTVFINETGLDVDKSISGSYSSAHDVSIILGKLVKDYPSLIYDTGLDIKEFISESNLKHIASNTNISVNSIPNIIASKTGFTDLAGGNLAVVFDAGFMRPISVVVLGSSRDGRFSDIITLVNLTLEKITEKF